MEKIHVRGLSVEVYIGVPDIERSHPQRLLIDLTLEADLSRAVFEDDFAQTIDYQKIVEDVQTTAASRSFSLIEGLAGTVAEVVLQDTRVESVKVKVRKFPIQLEHRIEHVAVEIQRRRT